ncbi:MAG: phosphatidylserine decarboxylase, partial [Thiotrichales bacterium]
MFTKLQYLTPRHLLSRLAGIIANCKLTWVRDRTIGYFLKRHHPNMAETKRQEIAEYTCFNDFFTRTLLPEARPIDP